MTACSANLDLDEAVKETKICLNYIWAIENFTEQSSEVGKKLESTLFSATGNVLDKWGLLCYPGGVMTKCEGYVSVYLYSAYINTAKAKLTIINSNRERVNEYELHTHRYVPNGGWGTPTFISRKSLLSQENSLLPGNTLRILVEITMLRKPNTESDTALYRLNKDLRKLHLNPQFSDITLVIGEEELPAHRNILSARSAVFSRMLDTQMVESVSKRIVFEDISKKALEEMLYYLYTGTSPKIIELCHELYYIADKYLLNELKAICEVTLRNDLTLQNCVEALVLTDRFRSEELKSSILDYIVDNMKSVMALKSWEGITRHPTLVNDVLAHHVKKYGKTAD